MTTIRFTVMPPPEALIQDVECIRLASHSGYQPLEVKVCPGGYPGLVFQLAADRKAAIESIAIRSGQTSDIPLLFLHGQGSQPSIMRFRGAPYTTIQVVFKPHALYSVFGWDASLFNQALSPPDGFGALDLQNQLEEQSSDEERINRLLHFLMVTKQQYGKQDELIERTLGYIREEIASVSVKELIAAFSISERQFQKRFLRAVGMTPQLFIRIRRVNEALRMMHSGEYERLSDVAYALNYYDQSHFIREMKSFSWVSPKHMTMRVSEFHSDLAGSSYL
ncbi:AraC family transcriptional regulator [Paenibacillus aurantius]|uniref:AraC family transcriptional regulator n=1 Tax=Paenibacillus aurantius TaxID=2918900 RepID=A0AA96RGB4_9BACL|nr:AraC family transcriptional regulator [Paenibacillus aurantius]WNQ09869.1 AraC family transcriptional regulator [Paenibacillus aurantius]